MHADDIVRFLTPGTRTPKPAMESEARNDITLARLQAGEANARDGDEPGLLRQDLDVAERFEERDIFAGGGKDLGLRTGEEPLRREPAARVPRFRLTRRAPHFGQVHSGRSATAVTLSRALAQALALRI